MSDTITITLATSEARAMLAQHKAIREEVDLFCLLGLPGMILADRAHHKVWCAMDAVLLAGHTGTDGAHQAARDRLMWR